MTKAQTCIQNIYNMVIHLVEDTGDLSHDDVVALEAKLTAYLDGKREGAA